MKTHNMLTKKNDMRLILFLFVVFLGMISCSSTKSSTYNSNSISSKRIKNHNSELPNHEIEGYTSTSSGKESFRTKKPIYTKSTKQNGINVKEELFRENVYETASQYLGLSYRSGGRTPASGFDCSGFAIYVLNHHGIKIYGSSRDVSLMGVDKPKDKLEVGDLVFFGRNSKSIHHVGMVSANNDGEIEMIHSASSTGISIDVIDKSDYWRKKFLFGRDVIRPFLEDKK